MKTACFVLLAGFVLSGCSLLNSIMCVENGYTYDTQLCHMLRGEPYYSRDTRETIEIQNMKTGERTRYKIKKY
jgi:hypothetical protein